MTAAVAFAVLAVLVGSGAATHLDQWAVEHAMPLAGVPSTAPTSLESVVPLLARAASIRSASAWPRS